MVTPNPILLSLYSLPFYPEFIISLIAKTCYHEENNFLFRGSLLNKSELE